MKRHGDLWEKIISLENLNTAYLNARKGKRWQRKIMKFEENIISNLVYIQRSLITKTFTTSEYKVKRIYEPKERDIYILPFYPDRIIQHALLRIVIPIWDGLMINDSYACREGKGMHQASRKAMLHIKKYDYCLKCDIKKFYPSIVHNILMAIIRKKIKCKDTLWLIENIVRSFDGGKNTPIGNFTSQWLGNLYMNELDQWIKQIKRRKAYIRYCDDFVLFDNDKAELHKLKNEIEVFLKDELELTFSKWSIFPVTQGVDFLGYRHFREKILLRKSTAKRVKKRMTLLPKRLEQNEITIDQYRSSIASTEGWLRWSNSYNLIESLNINQIKEEYGWFSKNNTNKT
jgi:RNA-directed DNA polymerase